MPKHTWPYTVHFSDVATLEVGGGKDGTSVRIFRCNATDLESLRGAYDRIAAAAAHYDYVCGFACGAVALMQWIASSECQRLFGRPQPANDSEVIALNARLHLFPGLSWGKDSEAPFLSFLSSVPKSARIMVVDCSFTGGAVAAAANVIADTNACSRTSIFAVVDRTRLNHDKLASAYRLVRSQRIGGVILQEVTSLLAEDFPELLGYDALQERSALVPQWRPGVVAVLDAGTGRYHVCASQPLHSVFKGLMAPRQPLEFCIDEQDLNQTCAETLYFVLQNMLLSEFERLKTSDEARDAYTLLKAKGKLCERWRRQVQEIAKTFSVEADTEQPEFCASIAKDCAVLKGGARFVEIADDPMGVLVSVNCAFTDRKNHSRTDFSFVLSADELAAAKSEQTSLRDAVPLDMIDDFDRMWQQQSPSDQEELRLAWGASLAMYEPAHL